MTIICDICSAIIEQPDLREEPTSDGIRAVFACPECESTFEAYRLSAAGLRIREQFRSSTDPNTLRERLAPHIAKGEGLIHA